jgi:hypothetical protein
MHFFTSNEFKAILFDKYILSVISTFICHNFTYVQPLSDLTYLIYSKGMKDVPHCLQHTLDASLLFIHCIMCRLCCANVVPSYTHSLHAKTKVLFRTVDCSHVSMLTVGDLGALCLLLTN